MRTGLINEDMALFCDEEKMSIGIDPGSSVSGVCILCDKRIVGAFNWLNPTLWAKITHFLIHRSVTVIIEDMQPYAIQLTPQVISTCKWIGELVHRLRYDAGVNVELVTRFEVKKWIFDSFPEVCQPLIRQKIDKKMFLACDVISQENVWVDTAGKGRRKQSFVFVDDKIVTESMKKLYGIELPKPGSGYQFGLKDHSWQALACVSWFIHKGQKVVCP